MATGTSDASASSSDGEMGLIIIGKIQRPRNRTKCSVAKSRLLKEMKLPIVIHNRDATEDCYKILKEEGIQDIGELCIVIMETWNL